MATKSMAKAFIDDTSGLMLDNLYKLSKYVCGDKKVAEKLVKNIIKIVVKIGLTYRNDQLSQEEIMIAEDFKKKFRSMMMVLPLIILTKSLSRLNLKDVAREIAKRHACDFLGQIGDLDSHYLLEHRHISKRSTKENTHHVQKLKDDRDVLWAEQQYAKKRVKRDYVEEDLPSHNISKRTTIRTAKSAPKDFTDVLYDKQWYLHHGAKGSNDMNVIPCWQQGYSGKNVVVTILDDGIQTDHPDLVANYDAAASLDINGNDDDPMPRDNEDNKHGTRCAGEIASMAFNDYCGVGIAYNARIGGVRMLDGRVTDAVEARALSHNPQHIDIYSASWGPEDNGATVDGPGRLAKLAFSNGVLKGRKGKGSIFVWASGNGGRFSDNCNCDGYTNSIYTLSISSATHKNIKPWYLEQCSSTLATTYSSGQPLADPNVVTVDMYRGYVRDKVAGRKGDATKLCTERHTGTSASAPMAAGMCALALEANPNLTWRDMQHIVIITSRHEPLSRVAGWITNGVNRKDNSDVEYEPMESDNETIDSYESGDVLSEHEDDSVMLSDSWKRIADIFSDCRPNSLPELVRNFSGINPALNLSHKFGYGLMDGENMVNLASKWKTVPPQRKCDSVEDNTRREIPYTYQGKMLSSIHSTGCKGTQSEIRYLEHVQATITLKYVPRGNLLIKLISPMGTHSTLLFPRPADVTDNTFNNWPFLSVHFWGENPVGNWTLTILNAGVSMVHEPGIFHKWSLTMYGTYDNPMESEYKLITRPPPIFSNYTGPCDEQCLSGCFGSGSHQCYLCKNYQMESSPRVCIKMCPVTHFPDNGVCRLCHKSCLSCFGPHENDCQACRNNAYLKQDDMSCVETCPPGFYAYKEMGICILCEAQCKTCSKSPHHCDTCADGLVQVADHVKIHDDIHAVQFTATIILNACSAWNAVEESKIELNFNLKCESCSPSCDECYGPQQNQCLSCRPGEFLGNEECKSYCDNSYYADLSDRVCYLCHSGCKTCKNNSCDSCTEGHSLAQSQCLPDSCSEGDCSCDDDNCAICLESDKAECISCKSPYYLVNGTCVAECPESYFLSGDGHSCEPCSTHCTKCSNCKINKCTDCRQGFVLLDGKCLPNCPEGFYKARGGICKACDKSCKTCLSETSCISCPTDFYYVGGKCVSECPVGYYKSNMRRCIKCHRSCYSCNDDGPYACKSCNNGELTPQNKCVPCSFNEYYDIMKKKQAIFNTQSEQNYPKCTGFKSRRWGCRKATVN
ncbi:Proprotein convertase subtilisin/kexin type 5 [Nymphon striatum]|nr:Proprotein convertase subtilisin/kexin type 5 [Nymphon striatum]